MAGTAEPPEHRACRTPTTQERRGVESVVNQWRLGDSNWRNLYIGARHIGVIWEPGLPKEVIAAMNGDPVRDERLRAEGRCRTARLIAAEIRGLYSTSSERALLEAVAIAQRHAQTGPPSTQSAQEAPDAESGAGGSRGVSAGSSAPPFDGAA